MLYWIYDIPTFAFGALTMVVFVGGAWLTILALRSFVHARIHAKRSANDLVGATFSSFAVLYGLLLGLLAVGAYENFANVDENVSREAASLTVLYHMVSSYPSPIREELRGEIGAYTVDTIDRVWPLQEKGVLPSGQDRLAALYAALLSFKPHDPGEAVTHAETLRTLNQYAELRRARLVNVRHGLPTILWYVVAIGAVIAIVFVSLFDMELQVHLVLGGLFAAFLGMTIFLIAAMDHPFRGGVSISSDAFRNAYDSVMRLDASPGGSSSSPAVQGAAGRRVGGSR
jgi:hypothetical protein